MPSMSDGFNAAPAGADWFCGRAVTIRMKSLRDSAIAEAGEPIAELLTHRGLEFPDAESVHARRAAIREQFQTPCASSRKHEVGEHDFATVCEYFDRRSIQEEVQRYSPISDGRIGFMCGGEFGMEIDFSRVSSVDR